MVLLCYKQRIHVVFMKKFLFSLSLLLFIILSFTACSTIFDTNIGTTTWSSGEIKIMNSITINVTMELNSTANTVSIRTHSSQKDVPDYVETGDYKLLDDGNLSMELYSEEKGLRENVLAEVIKNNKETKIKLSSIYYNFYTINSEKSELRTFPRANVTFTKIK